MRKLESRIHLENGRSAYYQQSSSFKLLWAARPATRKVVSKKTILILGQKTLS